MANRNDAMAAQASAEAAEATETVLDREARRAAILKARAPDKSTVTRSRDTVVVACKLERGIKIRDGAFQKVQVPNPMGGVMYETLWKPNGVEIVIRGTNKTHGRSDDPDSPNSDGYALTFNVPEDVWERWEYDNRDSLMVKNRLIIAHAKKDDVKAETRENASRLTGMEPLRKERDPRTPRMVMREMDEDGNPRQLNSNATPVSF